MTKTPNKPVSGASFRDPSGFVFFHHGQVYRQVNQAYAGGYARLMDSGLYEKLTRAGLLIPHTESDLPAPQPEIAFKVIQPQRVPFVSYPYEWPFGLLKAAALATLSIQKRALKLGMSLKDASAYNIQLVNGKPALIDTLSFEQYPENQPWVAYRQFCQHFLAPLALMAHADVRLGQLLRVHMDGIPLDLASRLLPRRTWLGMGLLVHIHLHARAQKQYAGKTTPTPARPGQFSKEALLGLVESLEGAIRGLQWQPAGTEWGDYYDSTNYSDSAAEAKKNILSGWVDRVQPASLWDLGANDGSFSRIASGKGIDTVAFDIDPAAVEKNYRRLVEQKEKNLLPLLLDLTNPSPALGWHHQERDSLLQRGPAGMVFALALIHHLAISNNVPLDRLADFFAGAGDWLAIEFVPKSDSQVQRLLQTRVDIFPDYTPEGFEAAFATRFEIVEKAPVAESQRTLYLMKRQ